MPSQRDPPSKLAVTNRAYWLWYRYPMRLFKMVAHFERCTEGGLAYKTVQGVKVFDSYGERSANGRIVAGGGGRSVAVGGAVCEDRYSG